MPTPCGTDILLEFETFCKMSLCKNIFRYLVWIAYKPQSSFQVVFKNGDYSDVTDQTITDIREYLNKLDYQYAMAVGCFTTMPVMPPKKKFLILRFL